DAGQVQPGQLAQARREVGRVGRRAVRVRDGPQALAAAGAPGGRRQKVLPAAAENPARAHKGRAGRGHLRAPLAFELRRAVGAQGVRVVALRVEAFDPPTVEDVVGRDGDKRCACEARGGGEYLDALRVDEEGALRVKLAAVNVRPRRAVDGRVGAHASEGIARRALVRDVQALSVEGRDLVAPPRAVLDDGATE